MRREQKKMLKQRERTQGFIENKGVAVFGGEKRTGF
jgi:hypothetical protein